MSRVAYVNGTVSAARPRPSIHVEDRGFQFADGVYEVWSVFDGRMADFDGHMTRLHRSLNELRIDIPMSARGPDAGAEGDDPPQPGPRTASSICRSRAARPGAITRSRRRTPRPASSSPPARSAPRKAEAQAAKGVAVITQPDIRWGRCDIKTVGLLANVLAKQAARERGAYEAWMVDEMGLVTEGSSTNAWIVDEHGKLRTRDTQANILKGITRTAIMDLIASEELELDERPFSVDDAKAAQGGLLHRRREPSSCRRCRSTAPRSATASPARSRRNCATLYLDRAKRDAV